MKCVCDVMFECRFSCAMVCMHMLEDKFPECVLFFHLEVWGCQACMTSTSTFWATSLSPKLDNRQIRKDNTFCFCLFWDRVLLLWDRQPGLPLEFTVECRLVEFKLKPLNWKSPTSAYRVLGLQSELLSLRSYVWLSSPGLFKHILCLLMNINATLWRIIFLGIWIKEKYKASQRKQIILLSSYFQSSPNR